MREVDGKVIYEVQLRQRIEGKVGDWRHEAETAKTYVLVDGLKPNTTYDVRIRGWIGGKAGKWKIHENAFKTSSEHGGGEGEDHEDGEQDGDVEGEGGDRDGDEVGKDEDGDGVDESTSPVIASIKGKAEASIAKIGWRLMREVDGKVIYEVQLRQRIEGKVGDWRHEAETAKTYVLVDGLKPNTTYDVRIRGWIGGKAGKWKIHENAFKTSSEHGGGEGEDHEDGEQDGDVEGEGGDRDGDEVGKDEDGDGVDESTSPVIASIKGKAEASIAKIGWRLMREVDGKVIYEVQLRQRIEGKVGDWRHEAETAKTYVLVDGLKPNTTYDVRIRGWIGGKAGKWKIHENAFKTSSEHGGGEGEDHEDGEQDGDVEGEGGDRDGDEVGEDEDGDGVDESTSPVIASGLSLPFDRSDDWTCRFIHSVSVFVFANFVPVTVSAFAFYVPILLSIFVVFSFSAPMFR